jgi:hypothetical protein
MRRKEKERIKIDQEANVNIVDWLLAIDFDVGQSRGESKR